MTFRITTNQINLKSYNFIFDVLLKENKTLLLTNHERRKYNNA